MRNFHPNFLIKNGTKEFAVLPYNEFIDIQDKLEDYEDLVELRNAKVKEKHAKTTSLKEARKKLRIK